MEKISCEEVIKATGGKLISGNMGMGFTNISTDSRKISEGDLFIPIIGDRFDGHDFIESSFEAGAAAVLSQKNIRPQDDKAMILVEDTKKALRDLAAYYRQKFKIPFVCITGSVGKTSTKDMVASVLSQKYRVLKTEGNLNNEIGLPLTIFNLTYSHEAAVIEMGMSDFGEISKLTAIARPDIAIISNIGLAHIEKLGSRQNILKAKMEILEGLSKEGLVILNGDDKLLYGLKDLLEFKTIYYGMEEDMNYQAYNVQTVGEHGTNFEIAIGDHEYKIHIPVPGVHNVYNALAAITVAVELKIPVDDIIKGISEFSAGKMRLNIFTHNEVKIINDAYNASPQSMEAAINVLKDIAEGRRTLAILGDMLEMGEWAYKAHVDMGKFAASKGIDHIITVGEMGRNIAAGAMEEGVSGDKVHAFKSNDEVNEFLKEFIRRGDVLLVKASRGMKMEQIVEYLCSLDHYSR